MLTRTLSLLALSLLALACDPMEPPPLEPDDAGPLDAGFRDGGLTDSGTEDGGVAQGGPVRGVNVQGAFRSILHPGLAETEVIERVSHAITTLGFDSIRIGGTPLYGASWNPSVPGYGWSEYLDVAEVAEVHASDPHSGEAWNFNDMALRTAQHAGTSVWIDFHRHMSSSEIDAVYARAADLGVEVAGASRDNEPYVPERAAHMEAAYLEMRGAAFGAMHWPSMYVLPEGQPENRRLRQQTVNDLVAMHRTAGEGIELHIYFEPGLPAPYDTPRGYITHALEDSAARHGMDPGQLMVGEWSGKNHETFTDADLVAVITAYLDVFCAQGIDNYYQVLGSTPIDNHGLWNFSMDVDPLGTPNRGADAFMAHSCDE
ncbi:MAG: hypothetical protein AB8I08_39610 [Sandaracinaceae bacterium]